MYNFASLAFNLTRQFYNKVWKVWVKLDRKDFDSLKQQHPSFSFLVVEDRTVRYIRKWSDKYPLERKRLRKNCKNNKNCFVRDSRWVSSYLLGNALSLSLSLSSTYTYQVNLHSPTLSHCAFLACTAHILFTLSLSLCARTHMHTRTHSHTHTLAHALAHTHTRTHALAHAHSHTLTHTHQSRHNGFWNEMRAMTRVSSGWNYFRSTLISISLTTQRLVGGLATSAEKRRGFESFWNRKSRH